MIAAVLLAAGESKRMGRPKLALPWGLAGSVIAHVVGRFAEAGAQPLVVVTGADREAIERALHGIRAALVHNPDYRHGGMLSSLRVGLRYLQGGEAEGTLLAPADLPALRADTIRAVLERRAQSDADLIVPSYQMRRGHPVLIGRPLWTDLLEPSELQSLRDFLRWRAEQIDYVVVDDPGVIEDLDTPAEYEQGSGQDAS